MLCSCCILKTLFPYCCGDSLVCVELITWLTFHLLSRINSRKLFFDYERIRRSNVANDDDDDDASVIVIIIFVIVMLMI